MEFGVEDLRLLKTPANDADSRAKYLFPALVWNVEPGRPESGKARVWGRPEYGKAREWEGQSVGGASHKRPPHNSVVGLAAGLPL